MPNRDTAEVRAVTLVDIPLVRRLSETGIVLDSELTYTQDGSHNSRLFTLFLPSRGIHTMVARAEKRQIVGQFRMRSDVTFAHIAYIAPALEEGENDTLWLYILDAMAAEAGRKGAHMLTAEVDESAVLFKTLRLASYAIYARQEIWRMLPEDRPADVRADEIDVTETTEADLQGIHLLYGNIVPRLVQQITHLPGVGEGYVYRTEERVEGYVGVAVGKIGVYLTPHLHPDVFSEAPDIIRAVMRRVARNHKLPIYVRVRRYQDWLDDVLIDLGFELCARQAVMVKHIAAGIRSAAYTPLSQVLESVPSPAQPPPSGIDRSIQDFNEGFRQKDSADAVPCPTIRQPE
jgi:hypothetical protein